MKRSTEIKLREWNIRPEWNSGYETFNQNTILGMIPTTSWITSFVIVRM